MPLTDAELEQLVALGATDEEITELDRESAPAPVAAPKPSNEMTVLEAAKGAVPFAGSAEALLKGQYTAGGPAETVGRVAGDVGTAAGLGASTALLGGPATLMGVGLGVPAAVALEKTGVSPWLRGKAQEISEGGEMPESRSVAWNLLQRVPREAASTAVGLVPALAAGGLGLLGLKGLAAGAGKAAQMRVNAPGAAGALQEAGGQVTPAMVRAAEGRPGGVPAGVESAVRANPLTSGVMRNIDKANVEAIQKTLSADVPASQMTPATAGGLLEKTLEAFQLRRGKAVGSAKDALRQVEAGDVGSIASGKLTAKLQEAGISLDDIGNPIVTGKERMGAATAGALADAARTLRGATLGEAINYLDNFDQNVAGALAQKYGNTATSAIKDARKLIKQTIVAEAEKASAPLARALTEADRAYSVSQPTVKSALTKARGEVPTSDLVRSVFGRAGSKADKGLRRLKSTMTPDEFGAVQDTLASEVARQATGPNGLSLSKLETALKEMGENAQYLKPDALAGFRKAADMMRAAGVVELQIPNPSGTAARLTQNLLTLGGAAGIGGVFGAPLPVAAGAAGLSGLGAAYMKLPQMARAFRGAVKPRASALAQSLSSVRPAGVLAGAAIPSTLRDSLEQASR